MIHTYLIKQSGDYLKCPIYKIGRSIDVHQRLAQLADNSIHDYELTASIDKDIEFQLHCSLYLYRIKNNREWFELDEQTLELLVLPIFNKEIDDEVLLTSKPKLNNIKLKFEAPNLELIRGRKRDFFSGDLHRILIDKEQSLLFVHTNWEAQFRAMLSMLVKISNPLMPKMVFTRKAMEESEEYLEFKKLTNNLNSKSNQFITTFLKNELYILPKLTGGKSQKYTIDWWGEDYCKENVLEVYSKAGSLYNEQQITEVLTFNPDWLEDEY